MAYTAERTNRARKTFLDTLERGYSISRAAKDAGRSVSMFRRWRKDDENFKQDWDDALEAGTDKLEDRARDRAMRDSDGLMALMLKARRPDKYRERSSVEHSGGIDLSGSRDKLKSRLDTLAARRGKGSVPRKPE